MKKNRLRGLQQTANGSDPSVQKGLMNIYSNKDGSLPDISHLEVKRRGRWKILLFALVIIGLLVGGIVWLSFIIFNPSQNLSNQSIELILNGNKSISSGDEVVYTLEYKNIEKVDLNEVEIIFRYPEGFEFMEAEPEPTNNFNSSWKIGTLRKQEEGKIEIRGKLIGEVGSLKTLNATVSFQPQNFSSVFKETTFFNSQITSSILEIEIDGPEQVLAEKKATYKISYRNNSDQELEKIKILVDYPTNFIFQESEPKPFHREDDARNLNNQWIIENLGKNQEGEIEITGGYLSDEELPAGKITVQIGFMDEETDEFSLQQEEAITTEIIEANLTFNLILNGSTESQPINFGQTLTYSLVYKNLGQKDLDDVSFKVTLDSEILDWETLEDKNMGLIEKNTLTWSKDQISELDLVRPLDEGSINFAINIKEAEDINLEAADLKVKSTADLMLKKIGKLEIEDFVLAGNEIKSNINTDIQLKVEGRYFDDDNIPVGIGPLPPVVGQKTIFRIYWAIANSLHNVSDVKVTTILPNGVEWADKYLVGVGEIKYSSSAKQVTWEIDQISLNKGFEDVNVWFDVSVVPTKQQVRKLLILTDQAELTATDQETESEVYKIGKAVTSNLEDDPIGGGRGLVIDITE